MSNADLEEEEERKKEKKGPKEIILFICSISSPSFALLLM